MTGNPIIIHRIINTNRKIQVFVVPHSVSLMTAMTTKLNVFSLIFILLGFVSCSQNPGIEDTVRKIFLTKNFNSTESEWILNSARESFLYLKDAEKNPDVNGKLNFVKNYANFLLKLFNELQTKDVDIYELFTKENSFLKGYEPAHVGGEFNITELKAKVEELLITADKQLMDHCNSSNKCYKAQEVLAMDKTRFDTFLKEKLRAEYGEIGYFFLEVFATLIGLSWGFISVVIYISETATAGMGR